MHFAFTDQQLEFRDAVRGFLARECTTDDVRAAYDAPTDRSPRWSALAELGVTGLTVPEVHGGLGLGMVDLVPLVEEAGRAALPEHLAATTGVVAPLLTDLEAAGAGGDRVGRWLEDIASGELTAAVADARRHGEPVAGADGAGLLILVADGPDGPELHGREAGTTPVTPVPSLDPTRRLGLPGWEPTPGTVLATGSTATALIERIADRAAVAVGAELLGLADTLIGRSANYARDRQQFGRPIGSFQAVKHLLAGAAVALEFARPAVYGGAWALDEGVDQASRSASVAKACASDAAVEAARVALQVHGAIGYTWECDVHLFTKRVWALSEAWGSAHDHRARILDSLVAGD